MAVNKRRKRWHIKFRVFGRQIGVATKARHKVEAQRIEKMLLTACRSGDYGSLDSESREVCVRMFRNQGWEIPQNLLSDRPVRKELTLWEGIEICLKYPEVSKSPNRERHEYAFLHLVEKLGKDVPLKSIWIPQIKEYQIARLADGAAGSTINNEKAAL
jgi:hypothetical protein